MNFRILATALLIGGTVFSSSAEVKKDKKRKRRLRIY